MATFDFGALYNVHALTAVKRVYESRLSARPTTTRLSVTKRRCVLTLRFSGDDRLLRR